MKYQAITEGLIETEVDRVSIFIGGEHIISVIPQSSLRKTMTCINMAIDAYYSAYLNVAGKLPEDRAIVKKFINVKRGLSRVLKVVAGK